jgi:hypothetical protein
MLNHPWVLRLAGIVLGAIFIYAAVPKASPSWPASGGARPRSSPPACS